jgi:hypothetical protein
MELTVNKPTRDKIFSIEDDCGFDFVDIIKDMATKKDYVGCVWNAPQLAELFDMDVDVIRRIAKHYKIPLTHKRESHPKLHEDLCWVKYGISIEGYLKSRYRWMRIEEMTKDLNISLDTLRILMRKYKLRKNRGWQ